MLSGRGKVFFKAFALKKIFFFFKCGGIIAVRRIHTFLGNSSLQQAWLNLPFTVLFSSTQGELAALWADLIKEKNHSGVIQRKNEPISEALADEMSILRDSTEHFCSMDLYLGQAGTFLR